MSGHILDLTLILLKLIYKFYVYKKQYKAFDKAIIILIILRIPLPIREKDS